jgi:hypothetical protein
MPASKKRRRWTDLPAPARAQIEQLLDSPVLAAENREGGFSPAPRPGAGRRGQTRLGLGRGTIGRLQRRLTGRPGSS